MNALKKMITAYRNGIKIPYKAKRAADEAGIPYAVMCAFLEQESAGGDNIFGQDPTIFVRAGKVTKKKYLRYKAKRQAGKGMQGVGPMQLTWWEFQDRADALGGCWRPYNNCLVGAQIISGYWGRYADWKKVAAKYNGSGQDAIDYGEEVYARIEKWKELLK